VHAVVPARNEADVLPRTLRALAAQRYPGRFAITLVDDRSDDGTGDAARAVTGVGVIEGATRPAGWTGKMWALEQGVRAARAAGAAPRYWWFTDADVEHAPETLARLVATAEAERRDLVSLMVALHCESVVERLLIPAFVFFFAKLYPFTWVADPENPTAAAAGGCVLLTSDALARIGGIARIRGELIDDCALAAAVKSTGGNIRLELSSSSRSIRPYENFGTVWSMVARSAYTQLGHSPWMLAGTVAGMTFLYLVPPVATTLGLARRKYGLALGGAVAWTLLSAAYVPMLRRYRVTPLAAPLLPLAALLYTGMTVDSAIRHLAGRGGAWKGRTFTPSP
jgi:hopene-associated glycosyltransferase HpnB